MYVTFVQCSHCVKKTLTVSCTLLCESGDKVKVDQSSFSADLHAVMLHHHCWEYARLPCGVKLKKQKRKSPCAGQLITKTKKLGIIIIFFLSQTKCHIMLVILNLLQ